MPFTSKLVGSGPASNRYRCPATSTAVPRTTSGFQGRGIGVTARPRWTESSGSRPRAGPPQAAKPSAAPLAISSRLLRTWARGVIGSYRYSYNFKTICDQRRPVLVSNTGTGFDCLRADSFLRQSRTLKLLIFPFSWKRRFLTLFLWGRLCRNSASLHSIDKLISQLANGPTVFPK